MAPRHTKIERNPFFQVRSKRNKQTMYQGELIVETEIYSCKCLTCTLQCVGVQRYRIEESVNVGMCFLFFSPHSIRMDCGVPPHLQTIVYMWAFLFTLYTAYCPLRQMATPLPCGKPKAHAILRALPAQLCVATATVPVCYYENSPGTTCE